MKKILFFLLLFFVPIVMQAQSISEKLIYKFENIGTADAYSMKNDEKTGTFIYVNYDTNKAVKSSIISNKGNSADYDYINSYSALFDGDGNYYIVAYKSLSDTSGKNYFLKNGKEMFSYDYIGSDLLELNGKIYMQCTDKDKSFIASFNISDGTFAKGKEYDEVLLCQYDKNVYEGEPIPKIGASKNGEIYYIARAGDNVFMVIGDKEQKNYSDIDAYSVTEDKSGNFAFIAKDKGKFIGTGESFVVYGDKKYKPFYSIYNLILDDKGNAYYIALDSVNDTYPQRVMSGDKEVSRVFDGGIYLLELTPDGKLYYIANDKKKGSDEFESYVVFDGKKQKTYQYIYNLKLYPGNELVYVAQPDENNYLVVKGKDEFKIEKKYSVLSADLLANGILSYVTAQYGDYEKKIKDKYFVHIGDKKFGPYDGVMMPDYSKNTYVISDKSGNYSYLVNNVDENMVYTYVLYTNTGKSDVFESIFDVHFYNGKTLFTAMRLVDKDNYTYKYRLYYDNKPISPEYDSISEFKFDEETGIMTFIIAKGNEIYKVEIKL